MSNVIALTQETRTLTDSLEDMNKALASMKTYYDNLNKSQEKAVKLKKLNKNELRETVQDEEGLKKRTKILNTTLKLNNDMLTFGIKSLSDYRKAGGTTLEYLATFMTSTKEEVRLLGFEAASARRFMYGFLPPGMFRLVNKVATAFNGMGSAIRAIRDSASGANKESGNLFSTLAAGMVGLAKLPKMNINDFKNMREERKKILKKSRRMSGGIAGQGITIRSLERRIKATEAGGMDASYLKTRLKKEKELLEKMNISRTKYLEKSKLGRRILLMGNVFKVLNPKKVALFFGKALKFFFVTMLYFTLFLTVLYILYNTVGKSLMNAFEETRPLIEKIAKTFMASLGLIWSGIQDIWSAFFGGGNLENIIDGVFKIGVGILGAALTVIGGLLAVLGALIWNTITDMGSRAFNYLTKEFLTIKGFLTSIPMIIGIIAGVVAFIYGAPIWLAGLAFLVLYKFGAWMVRKIKKSLGLFANGGVVNTPMQVVGERGPELVKLPQGSRVYSNSTSKKMVGGKSVVNNFNITVNAKDSSKAEMRRMADEIGRMINSKINRSTSSSTFR
tara:strand:- start:3353 stop:5035 length:1683 start_codon:yes stop_codon:yes gene_type:complete